MRTTCVSPTIIKKNRNRTWGITYLYSMLLGTRGWTTEETSGAKEDGFQRSLLGGEQN